MYNITSYLSHHSEERPRFERLERHADEVLVEKGADEEHGDRCGILLVAHLYDGNVQVAGTESEQKWFSRLARLTGGEERREREREEITRPLNRKDRELSLPRFPLDHSLPRGEFYVGRKGNEPFSAMQSVLLLLQLTLYRGMVEKKRKKKERERIGGKEREGWRQEIRSVAF